MNRIIPIGLMIVLATTGCTGPGGLFGDDDETEEPFVYDLTIEDLWTDIPENMTSASDIINMTYELEKSPRVTNFTEIGYSINGQPLLLLEFGNYDPSVPTVYFVDEFLVDCLLRWIVPFQNSCDPYRITTS